MAAPLKIAPQSDLAALGQVAARLIERVLGEIADAERPLARLAGERCAQHIAACAEWLAVTGQLRVPERPSALRRARRAVIAARCDLDLVQSQGTLLPPVYRTISAGLEVLRRRIGELAGAPP